MKNILLIIGILCFNLLKAQDTLKLTIDNPEPRVGDKVELSFLFNFFTEDLKGQLNDDIILSNFPDFFGSQNDNFTKTIEFTKTGFKTIGPFKFDFNGRTIITDSIIIDVAEKLPFKEGLWIRLTSDHEGGRFLIIEQLITNKSDYTQNERGTTYTIGGKLNENIEFTEIEEINEDGIKIEFRQSKSNTVTNNSEDFSTPGLTYSYKKYEVKFHEEFNDTFILKKKNLKNFPKKVSFSNIEIKR